MSTESRLLSPVVGMSTAAITGPTDGTFPVDLDRRQILTFENLELRLDEMRALVESTQVGLTVREFQVLAVLASREDRVVRRTEIYRQVWGSEMKYRDRAVDVFVRKLRTKLIAVAPTWRYIHTHFGIGYRFAPEPVSEQAPQQVSELQTGVHESPDAGKRIIS